VIKATYCSEWKVGKDGMRVDALLDPYELDLQCLFLKMTMATNSESMLKEVLDKNLVAQLWAKITCSPIFKIKL
jgi:hypothetical protein